MNKPFSDNLLTTQGEAYYFPNFFTSADSDTYLEQLISKVHWKQEPIKIFGKSIMQPRLIAWVGDPEATYKYSGNKMEPQPWPPAVLEIKSKIEAFSEVSFNGALLNFYRDQNDSIGWHRDNEKELGKEPFIASVSFGEKRKFLFQNIHDKNLKVSIELEHGSLLIMKGEAQNFWKHSLPKQSKKAQARVNITLRRIVNG